MSSSVARQNLESARAKWKAQALTDYVLTERVGCFCPPPIPEPMQVTVRANAVVSVEAAPGGVVPDPQIWRVWKTVDELFAEVEEALDKNAFELRVTYDPVRGFPTELDIDPNQSTADEESGYTVTSLRPLNAP